MGQLTKVTRILDPRFNYKTAKVKWLPDCLKFLSGKGALSQSVQRFLGLLFVVKAVKLNVRKIVVRYIVNFDPGCLFTKLSQTYSYESY